MTTPAHCTRTDPHPAHETGAGRVTGARRCPGVEPPADVAATPDLCNAWWNWPGRPGHRDHACILTSHGFIGYHVCACGNSSKSPEDPPIAATPDPRLDVVERTALVTRSEAQRILDALDDHARTLGVRDCDGLAHTSWGMISCDLAAAQTMHEPDEGLELDLGTALMSEETALRIVAALEQPAPAGPTVAQKIRLAVLEIHKHTSGSDTTRDEDAAWVEHGPDETPSLRVRRDELQRWKDAEARADRAEARLGQVRTAWETHGDPLADDPFSEALRDALAWTPDDGATADDEAVTP